MRNKNTTTFYLVILLIIVIALILYISQVAETNTTTIIRPTSSIELANIDTTLRGISTRQMPCESAGVIMDHPFAPPLRNDGVYFPRDAADVRGTIVEKCNSINITTRGLSPEFTQIGALFVKSEKEDGEPLPLFGRKIMSGGGDKWQYYTTSNRGIYPVRMSLKIDVGKREKSTMDEYGVDRLYSGDEVSIDAFRNKRYRVDVYENSTFRWM